MYRHCPSCTRDLGTNEALEHFPVGRRLAYDTRDAEELARISDALLTPDWMRRRIEGWRGGRG